jgi:hypothetical protein
MVIHYATGEQGESSALIPPFITIRRRRPIAETPCGKMA